MSSLVSVVPDCLKELVENSLDSAESISELPVVEITIEEIGKSKFNSMIGSVLMLHCMMILKLTRLVSYKINQIQDKIGVFVSIVSTKIPFKGTGKEYIRDDITEIASAVKYAIQQCCVQLKSKIVKKMLTREQQERKRNLIYNILKNTQLHASKKSRYGDDDEELLHKVSENLITKETLSEKLAKHVEQALIWSR
ncbi:hypothetical protein RJT34_01803 [Clitoria ternatea]|uniref:DNA topoisomerase VI subunit B transducer domain-containing protein n=1 Tax=Clitoria ternatea TaxID=43366 RepID=A0AAN9KIF8_CLITE